MASVNRGAEQLADLGKAFKKQSGTPLKKQLLAGIRKEGKPAILAARRSATSTLPSRGGLAARVSKTPIGVRTRLSGNSAGIQVKATGKGGASAVSEIDQGRVRHPVWGRAPWFSQSVRPGWFTKPMEAHEAQFRTSVTRVIDETARKIERSI